MKKQIAVLLFALSLCAAAEEPAKQLARLVPLNHVTRDAAERLLAVFVGTPVKISVVNGTVALSGPPDAVALVEEFIKKFDVPPPAQKNIDVTAYMLLGNQEETGDAASTPELAGVVKQLRSVFGFKSYRLLETMVVRSREGRGGEASGLMNPAQATADPSLKPLYQFKFNQSTLSTDDKGRSIHLDHVRFGGRIPIATSTKGGESQYQYLDTGINTDVDLREGQKVVVGKASIGTANTSLFLVLTAKVVD